MKYLFLVWCGIWRKRMRAVLILLQIVVAFTLFGVLQGLNTGVKQAITSADANRMYVQSRAGLGDTLPLALLPQIQRVHGVVSVSYAVYLSGTYQNRGQQIYASAVDAASFASDHPGIAIAPEQLEAFIRDRTGMIVGEQVARRYGWRIGQRVPVQLSVVQRDGSSDWAFDVAGIYTVPDNPEQANYIYVNYAYLNEAREDKRDTVSSFAIEIEDPRRSANVGHDIDTLFANSSHETRTQSESELATVEVQRIGDINFLAHAVTAAAFFALLFATGALMMQSIRERTPELAVLKTVGFTDSHVMILVLAEALACCMLGAGIGLGIAGLVLPRAGQLLGVAHLAGTVVVTGMGCAVLLALMGGSIAAWRALQLPVAAALSRR